MVPIWASRTRRSTSCPAAVKSRSKPGRRSTWRRSGPFVHQSEHLDEGRVPPAVLLTDVEDVGHRPTTSVSTRRGSDYSLEVLDRAQDEVGVRRWRSGPEDLDALGWSQELGKPRRQVRDIRRRQLQGGGPPPVLAVPPHDAPQRQGRRDHELDHTASSHSGTPVDESGDEGVPLDVTGSEGRWAGSSCAKGDRPSRTRQRQGACSPLPLPRYSGEGVLRQGPGRGPDFSAGSTEAGGCTCTT